jgi:hypothetical protein
MKSSKAEVLKRVNEVFQLRLGGAEFLDIREYADAPERAWGVSDTQLRRYVAAADALCKERFDARADHLLSRHLLQRRTLYAHAMGAGDFRTALAVLKDEAELEGLYPRRRSPRPTPPGRKNTPEVSAMPTAPPPSSASMPAWARGLEARLLRGRPAPTDRFWAEPSRVLAEAGLPPDPWQADVLGSTAPRLLLLCTRRAGKSLTAAALALLTALVEAPATVLLLSPTQRQSGELSRDMFLRLYHALGRPVRARRETALTLELANGSRVLSLPGNEGGIRGYSDVALLVVDEASRVPDDLYAAVRPMLAVSRGRLLALSTPFGKRGWFFQEWTGTNAWERARVTAGQCPRIAADFLAEERRSLGEHWYRQEYLCSFEDVVDAVFAAADIQAALSDEVQPLVFDWER